MDPSFIPIETVPSKTPFGLDQLRRSYKTALSAEAAIAAAPNVGDVDEVFPFMFLMPISTPESAESATRIDLVYMGCLGGESSPVLPDSKHDSDDAVMSATSGRPRSGVTPTSPMTAQYYAPTSQITYISYGAPGIIDADPPAGSPRIITIVMGDATFSGTPGEIVANFFVTQLITTRQSVEIVPGKYWQNVSKTTASLSPWVFAFPSGPHVSLASQSSGYAAGDVITISAGGESATVNVDTVFEDTGYILGYHELTNTFTVAHTQIPGSAPTHGFPGQEYTALWNVYIIP